MHYNLLFNGCSFTWGAELEGVEENHEYREEKRFSHIISKKTNKTSINISACGSSNDRILRTTIEWFENGNTCDLAIIQLSLINRIEYIDQNNEYRNFSPNAMLSKYWSAHKFFTSNLLTCKQYYKFIHNDNFAVNSLYRNLFFLEEFFTQHHIKYLFISLDDLKIDNKKPNTYEKICKTKYNQIPNIKKDILNYDKKFYCTRLNHPCFPGIHPNKIGHEKIAEHLIPRIHNQYAL